MTLREPIVILLFSNLPGRSGSICHGINEAKTFVMFKHPKAGTSQVCHMR